MAGQRRSAQERRAAILDAAVKVFAREGFAGASTMTIADGAGVSQPNLFRLFPTKKALFEAAFELVTDQVCRAFVDAGARQAEPEAALHAMGEAYARLLAEAPDLLLVQLHGYASCGNEDIRTVVRAGFRRMVATVEAATGAPGDRVRAFVAAGMLLNATAAMRLDECDWAVSLTQWPDKQGETPDDNANPAGVGNDRRGDQGHLPL